MPPKLPRRTFLHALLGLPALATLRLPAQQEEQEPIIYTDSQATPPEQLAPLAEGAAIVVYQP
jgi:hypothetical protein